MQRIKFAEMLFRRIIAPISIGSRSQCELVYDILFDMTHSKIPNITKQYGIIKFSQDSHNKIHHDRIESYDLLESTSLFNK